jgi:hypothetical protein
MLSFSIALFVLSSYVYSYQSNNVIGTLSVASYPYKLYGVSFVGFGSALMVAASISYSRKSKLMQ